MPYVVATQVIHTANGTITKGQRVNTKEKIVKDAAAGLFVSADDAAKSHGPVTHRAVEAATAAPGETRNVTKPPTPQAKKATRKQVAKK